MKPTLSIIFWGCRGSVACSYPGNQRYGANTTCFEVRSPQLQSRLIVDAGTGINKLGVEVRESDSPHRPIHLFFSHSHWDHIQGLPFFSPIYDPQQSIVIHHHHSQDYAALLAKQMSPPFFPGTMETAQAQFRYEPFDCEPIVIDGIIVHPFPLRHTPDQRSCAFLIGQENKPARVVLCSDRQELPVEDYDETEDQFRQTAHGLDVLVHDAFFDNSDFITHENWGHCSIQFTVEEAQRLGAKRLYLHHYNPEYDDRRVDELLEMAIRVNGDHPLEILAAAEGQHITLY